MGLFDWVPTVDEVINWWDCRVMGHKWVECDDLRGDFICSQCGKVT